MFRQWAILALFLLVLQAIAGCQKATEPEDVRQVVAFVFTPDPDTLSLEMSGFLDFRVAPHPDVPIHVSWVSENDILASGPRFRFFPAAVGTFQLAAEVECNSLHYEHHWNIQVWQAEPEVVEFVPPGFSMLLIQGDSQDFEAKISGVEEFNLSWTLNDSLVSSHPHFLYEAHQAGLDTLDALVWAGEEEWSHRWIIQVQSIWQGIHFSPLGQAMDLVETQTREFRILDEPPESTAQWEINGQSVGSGNEYLYTAGPAGVDSLVAKITALGEIYSRMWEISVSPLGQFPPEEVPVHQVVYGTQVGQIRVAWTAIGEGVFPLSHYQVYFSLGGPITQANYLEAFTPEPVAFQEGLAYYEQVLGIEDGIQTDRTIWVAIRALDTAGQISPLGSSFPFTVQDGWFISGTVYNDRHEHLPNIRVASSLNDFIATTDDQGRYHLGPFPFNSEVSLNTNNPIPASRNLGVYHFDAPAFSTDLDQEYDFTLLTQYGCDPSCPANASDFLTYFKYVTKTSLTTPFRPDHRLYRWDQYPLDVYIPDFTNDDGVNLRDESIWALNLWNQQLNDIFFQVTSDEMQADLVFLFSNDNPDANGQVTLLQPHDQRYLMGDVIPEKMSVMINFDLPNVQRIRETALHELGHTLGLYRHSLCNDPGYLMYITASGALDNGPENAIHIDELRAVTAIRHLAQGIDMSCFHAP